MNIPPKYEDVVAQLVHAKRQYQEMLDEAIALRRDRDALRETLENSYTAEDHERFAAKGQELNVKYIEKLEQRLTVAEQLLRRVIACGELTRINHAELEADVCKWLEPVTPAEPRAVEMERLLRDASAWIKRNSCHGTDAIELWERIDAALKPAEEEKGS